VRTWASRSTPRYSSVYEGLRGEGAGDGASGCGAWRSTFLYGFGGSGGRAGEMGEGGSGGRFFS